MANNLVINRNKNNKSEKEGYPHTAPLKNIESTDEGKANDSLKEVFGDIIYVKKDESTYTRYI